MAAQEMTPNPVPVESSVASDALPPLKRHRRTRVGGDMSLNLTAMIDVTFLLLIYFMVATEFRLGEEVYRLDLPERQPAAAVQDPFDLDDEPLRIRLQSAGVGGRFASITLDGPYPAVESFDDLHEFLQSNRITEQSLGGLFEPDHPIILQPAPTLRWEWAVEGFNAAARAGYTNITFSRAP